MSYNENNRSNFDLSKPTFDLFSLRTIRNDALLQYNALNQSEPLRINLYLILTISLFSFPTVSEAVIGEQATIQSIIVSVLAGVGSFGLFIKECQSRLNQLSRIEKEMNAEYLQVSLSTTNKLNPKLFQEGSTSPTSSSDNSSLKSLRGKKRVVAICGTTNELKSVMESFRVFRRRLQQSNSIVVPVPTDLNTIEQRNNNSHGEKWWSMLGITESEIRSCQWLGQPNDISSWKEYFTNLVDDANSAQEGDNGSSGSSLVWFGLNYNGRSFASGSGIQNSPLVLQILGQNLRPIEILDESDECEMINPANKDVDVNVVNEIMDCQKEFYSALTEGDLDRMNTIHMDSKTNEVSEVRHSGYYELCLSALHSK